MALPEVQRGASPQEQRTPSRVGKLVMVLALLLIALGIAYAAGRLQTSSKIDQADGRAAAALGERDQTRKDLDAAYAKVQRLEARRRLHLALAGLEARNFGIAQGHLEAAAALLSQGNAGGPPALSELERDLRGARLVATEDLGVQRQRILDWTRRFDEVEPPAAARK